MRILLLLMLLAPTSALAAQRVLVLPFESTSVEADFTRSATELMIIYLKDRGLDTIPVAERPADVDAAARAANATHIVEGRLTRVGNRALVFVELRKPGEAQPGWTGRLTANRPDDLEAVMARMARGVDTGETVQEAKDIYSVTEREADALAREKANHYFGLHLGGTKAFNVDEVLPGVGIFWLYDVRKAMFEIELHTHVGDEGARAGVAINGYYPLSQDDFSPYIGGGLEYGMLGAKDELGEKKTGSGLAAQGGVGMLFGRTSTVALRADVKYFAAFYDVDDKTPHGVTFGVGLGF